MRLFFFVDSQSVTEFPHDLIIMQRHCWQRSRTSVGEYVPRSAHRCFIDFVASRQNERLDGVFFFSLLCVAILLVLRVTASRLMADEKGQLRKRR